MRKSESRKDLVLHQIKFCTVALPILLTILTFKKFYSQHVIKLTITHLYYRLLWFETEQFSNLFFIYLPTLNTEKEVKQSCQMSILLHGTKPSNQVLPQKMHKSQYFWDLNWTNKKNCTFFIMTTLLLKRTHFA